MSVVGVKMVPGDTLTAGAERVPTFTPVQLSLISMYFPGNGGSIASC